jgi:Skp family chaperone for outer membrane proteins
MKIKSVVILDCLIGVIFLLAGYQYCLAQPKEGANLKIGVVSVMRIFRECKRNIQYRQEALAEQKQVLAELEKISKELEADEAGLKTLKLGSPDHLKLYKQILEKRASMQAGQEYHKQQRALKERQITEELYKEILQVTKELSEQKGFDLVFESDEPELTSASSDELVLTISSHKLLYCGSCCTDITDDVIARLDAETK